MPSTRAHSYLDCLIDGRYHLTSIIGEGAMGVVYQCKHVVIGKRVAIKILRPELARNQHLTTCFLNEARAASAIGNPHIIDISDFGYLPNGPAYLVMELLDGEPLSRLLLNGRPIPFRKILRIGRQLATGLAAAHEAGIVHRDLKPDNIFLLVRGSEQDFVKILDFGIAKISAADDQLAHLGSTCGSPHYMSPEQAAGGTVDHRSDVYSLGVILYQLAAGRLPFEGEDAAGVMARHLNDVPPSIRRVAPTASHIRVHLESIVMKCLEKRPEQRYQSMRQIAIELQMLESGGAAATLLGLVPQPASDAKEPIRPSVAPRKRSRWSMMLGAAAGFAALGVAGGVRLLGHFGQGSRSTGSGTVEQTLSKAVPFTVEPSPSSPIVPSPTAHHASAIVGEARANSQLESHLGGDRATNTGSTASKAARAQDDSAPAVGEEVARPAQPASDLQSPGAAAGINRAAANAAMTAAATAAESCSSLAMPSNPKGNVAVTFAPDGSTAVVAISQHFAGTPAGACVLGHYRAIKIPPFTGESTTLFRAFDYTH